MPSPPFTSPHFPPCSLSILFLLSSCSLPTPVYHSILSSYTFAITLFTLFPVFTFLSSLLSFHSFTNAHFPPCSLFLFSTLLLHPFFLFLFPLFPHFLPCSLFFLLSSPLILLLFLISNPISSHSFTVPFSTLFPLHSYSFTIPHFTPYSLLFYPLFLSIPHDSLFPPCSSPLISLFLLISCTLSLFLYSHSLCLPTIHSPLILSLLLILHHFLSLFTLYSSHSFTTPLFHPVPYL